MTQGELEQIPEEVVKQISDLETRVMTDIVRRIRENGFSSAASDWQITRLQQLGMAESEIRKWIQETLGDIDVSLDKIFSDTVYEEYYGHARGYELFGREQVPFEENTQLQELIEAVRKQTEGTFRNITNSLGFAIRNPATGRITSSPLMEFYRDTLDNAILDIHSGVFSYGTVLERTIKTMTDSGLRWIDYGSGHRDRVDVAARRAVLTGFRQVQGKINESVAAELNTDQYEVTYHVGARPTHQPWQGKVWTMQQLIDVCGLGTVTGLHGINCYHDYEAFPPGSVRTYTDEQLERMNAEENRKKDYNGKEYTTYEALQHQRRMERNMRATRQQIKLLQEGGADPETVLLKKARYQGQLQAYRDFSEKMKLPLQMKRVYQDGLGTIRTSGILKNAAGQSIIKVERTTLKGAPNTITQKTSAKGGIERNYYGEDGMQIKQISNNNHGNAKMHPYGKNGEHAHDYSYDEKGKVLRSTRELTEIERKENGDIL